MSPREHFIYVNCDSISDNHFGVDLPATLRLEGEWKCGLIECSIKFFHKDLPNIPSGVFLLADFCSTSLVNERQLPVLRRFQLPKKAMINISPLIPLYIPIKQFWLNRLEFSLVDFDFNVLNVNSKCRIDLTLHLRKS